MEKQFGIASKKTYQWYPIGNQFKAIEENEYFEPTRKAVGVEIDAYSMQTVFYFLQNRNLIDADFLKDFLNKDTTPLYYKTFLSDVLNGVIIEESFCKESINIPAKTYTINDVFIASKFA